MAPELLHGHMYNETVDIFSFAIILCSLIARMEPDPDLIRNHDFGLDEAKFTPLATTAECPAPLLSLTLRCAAFEPKDRPSFESVEAELYLLDLKLSADEAEQVAIRKTTTGRREPHSAPGALAGLFNQPAGHHGPAAAAAAIPFSLQAVLVEQEAEAAADTPDAKVATQVPDSAAADGAAASNRAPPLSSGRRTSSVTTVSTGDHIETTFSARRSEAGADGDDGATGEALKISSPQQAPSSQQRVRLREHLV